MKAKQQAAEAEKASQDVTSGDLPSQKPGPQAEALKLDAVVFDGGFFKVESPAKSSSEGGKPTVLCFICSFYKCVCVCFQSGDPAV